MLISALFFIDSFLMTLKVYFGFILLTSLVEPYFTFYSYLYFNINI